MSMYVVESLKAFHVKCQMQIVQLKWQQLHYIDTIKVTECRRLRNHRARYREQLIQL